MANIRQIGQTKEEREGPRIGTIQMKAYGGLTGMDEQMAKMRAEKSEYERILALVEAFMSNPNYKPVDKVARGRVVALLREAKFRSDGNNFDMAIDLAKQALEKANGNIVEERQ